jgi:ElaB/YqjD/DUF883 family membrane-anchored ribosome-binding protein
MKGQKVMAAEILEKTASVDDVLREFGRIKAMVTDAVEEGVETALRAIKQGRVAAEDAIYDARHVVKRNPLQAVGVVFGAGVMIGGLLTWLGTRRR